ncbi:single-stranded-DNA-specific exonuclease RecJ [Niallia sp. SS-2023]|uniref:single-stranded-DNA-specific exonuclease RecJ n=1 Tax=Niallia sp. SS-2023 TaxID=3051155 RepID=UPI00254B9D78|nr:single-stranded-DNA-specific exonuclease RecJ [Niallia sp. SS-2023]MDL0436312.1 single-stranded-DNA-specific exonuclease RecJ [Niallia sp. SS-2023]
MLHPKSRWITEKKNNDNAAILADQLKITPLVASLLVNRGYDSLEKAKAFLYSIDEFHDPFLMKGMDIAVNRIKHAIDKQEPILIFGDYDADGVTSTTVMMKTLEDLGADVQFYIPNRFTEGYGPNEGAFRYAASIGIKLIVTVDTGIAAVKEADVAKELGIDYIVTDHHEPGLVLPDALAIIHPRLDGSEYPFHELAGVGVALKVAHALYGELPEHLLQFAAIGTIADLVSLTGENRIIAKLGIKKLKQTANIGLQALLKQMKTEASGIDEETIGFMIAPRINAVGRLDSADPAVELLLTDDPDLAASLAEEMEAINKERQAIVNQIMEEAIEQVETLYPLAENRVIIVGKEGWNPGVVGIVASRLVEKFYRPTIVLGFDQEKGIAKGSARSIAGFDLYQNLSTCREILPHFGGHPMAAGMTLALEDVDQLRQRLNQLAFDKLVPEDLVPLTAVDMEIDLKDAHLQAIEEMQLLAPFGVDNAKPRIVMDSVEISTIRKIGANQNHLKVQFQQEDTSLDGIGFGIGELYDHISPSAKVSVLGQLSINEWNNIKKPQIFIQDIAVKHWQLFDYRGIRNLEKLASAIPGNSATWIFFHKDSATPEALNSISDYKIIENLDDAASFQTENRILVLADFPHSKDIVQQLLASTAPERIYASFFKQDSDFFSTMPTRDHFKWYYAFLAKQNGFDLKKYGGELAKRQGWSKETIVFMSKVFFELNFVTMKDGFITLNKNSNRRDLTESPSFQQKQAQFSLENELIYSSYEQLKNWFDLILQKSVKNEEEVQEWI